MSSLTHIGRGSSTDPKESTEVKKGIDPSLVDAATALPCIDFKKLPPSDSPSNQAKSYGAWAVSSVHVPHHSKIFISTLSSSLLVLSDDYFSEVSHFRIPRISPNDDLPFKPSFFLRSW
ncbi:hypothetical protein GEMRC1_003137 [Eukaryota sp. GEM-RC1]